MPKRGICCHHRKTSQASRFQKDPTAARFQVAQVVVGQRVVPHVQVAEHERLMKLRRPVVFVGCIDTPARRRQLATGTIENSVGSTDGLRLRIDAVSVRMKHVEVCSTSCLRIHGLVRISLKSYGNPRQLRCRCRFRHRIKCSGYGLNRSVCLVAQPVPFCEPVRIVVGKPCGPRCVLPDQRL